MSATLIRPRSLVVPVWRDDVPRGEEPVMGGRLVQHWDGRQDATVFAPALRLRLVNEASLAGLTRRHRNAVLRGVEGGAFPTTSGMYATNFLKVFDGTQLAFAFLADAIRMAMYTNSIGATSYYTDVSQTAAPYNANEASGTGYTSPGYLLANKTCTQSPNGTVMFDNTVDPNWSITGSFAANVFGAVMHDTTISANGLLCAIYFGSGTGYNVTNGTFTIQLNALGINTLLVAA